MSKRKPLRDKIGCGSIASYFSAPPPKRLGVYPPDGRSGSAAVYGDTRDAEATARSCQSILDTALYIVCGELPSLLNGEVHVTSTTYRSRVNFTCEDGYDLVGASSAVCLVNGTWSEELPHCLSPVCHDWTVFNYSCYKFFDHPVQFDIADNNCLNHNGHVASINSMDENEFMTELVDKDIWLGLTVGSVNDTAVVSWLDTSPVTYTNWSGSDPTHQHAGQIGIVRVGGGKTGGWELVSDKASFPYVCKKGYRCGNLKPPIHGDLSVHNISVGSTATFVCNVGYHLAGNSTVTCQSNSLWSSISPTCLKLKSPQNVAVKERRSTSVYITWEFEAPVSINGQLAYFKVYYSSGNGFESTNPIRKSLAYNITGLSPYSQYTIYVTANNHVADGPDSDVPSNLITVTTMAGAPLKPGSPHLFSVETSMPTILLAAPYISDQNGPISYVDFVVHFIVIDSPGSTSPASTVPSFSDDSANGSTWYIAARFTFDEYSETLRGRNFILGSGLRTVDKQGIAYTNQPLVGGRRYTVYCRVTGTDLTGRVMSSTSDGIAFLTLDKEPEMSTAESRSSISTNVTGITVTTALSLIFLIVIAMLLMVVIRVQRRTGKLRTQNVSYRNVAGGSVELVDTGQDEDVVYTDPDLVCISNQTRCTSVITPCAKISRMEKATRDFVHGLVNMENTLTKVLSAATKNEVYYNNGRANGQVTVYT